MIRPFLFLALLLIIPSFAQAKGSVNVGDTIPHNLDLKDHSGKDRNFSNLTGEKGMVLVFVRSAEWCPFCQKQLIELSKNAGKFSDKGYNVVSISYDSIGKLGEFATKNKPKITMLSDPASSSIRAFGILNEASAKGTFSYGIPHPGTYIVSKDKKVQAKFFQDGYKDRVTPDQLLAEIKKLNPPPEPAPMTIENMGQDPIDPDNNVIGVPEKITEPIVLPEETVEEKVEEAVEEAIDSAPVIEESPAMPETPVPTSMPEMPVQESAPMADPKMPDMPELPAMDEPDTVPSTPEMPEMPKLDGAAEPENPASSSGW